MTKKLIVIIILIIIVVSIALMAPPITSQTNPPDQQKANLPSSTPAPLLKIDEKSNLSEEIKKLVVPEYESDYFALDQSLSQF